MQIAKTFHSALDSIAACHKPPDARKSTTPTTQIRCMLCIQHTRPYKFSSFIFFYFRFVSIMSLFCCMSEPRFVCHSFMLCPLVSVSSCFVVFFFFFFFLVFLVFVLLFSLFYFFLFFSVVVRAVKFTFLHARPPPGPPILLPSSLSPSSSLCG